MREEIFEKLSVLRSDILNSFPKTDFPRRQEITSGETHEERQIRADFEGKLWWNMPSGVLQSNYGSLAFFTPEAFHYFLPAYILASLDDFNPNNLVLEFTIYSLSPTKTKQNDAKYSERISQFDQQQRALITQFLRLILAAEFYTLYNDAERGLKKFWREDRT